MPPEPRLVPRFAAEPPQEGGLPYGRWAKRLSEAILAAWRALDASEGGELGEAGEIAWYPDRTWHGWTYVPASSRTSNGYELFGYVRFAAGGAGDGTDDEGGPAELSASADFTDQTAEHNPAWQIDLCEQAIGSWRGRGGGTARMTLVWGRPLLAGARVATAELGGVTVDQCELIEQRFTLIAPDDYQHDLLEVELWDAKGRRLAHESLYDDE